MPNIRLHNGVFVPADVSDPPFAVAADIVLDLPVPPSVNRTRRVNWASIPKIRAWVKAADNLGLLMGKRRKLPGRWEIHIAISEAHTKQDLDNCLKNLIDYVRRIELVVDDSQRFLRRINVTWGHAPEGVRVTLRESA